MHLERSESWPTCSAPSTRRSRLWASRDLERLAFQAKTPSISGFHEIDWGGGGREAPTIGAATLSSRKIHARATCAVV